MFSKKSIPPPNTRILQGLEAEPSAVREALDAGFQYLFEQRWHQFSWKTPESALAQTPGFSQETGVFGRPVWRLNAPVRLAGLELEHRLEINDNRVNPHSSVRTDVPLYYYGFFVAFGGDGRESYHNLKSHLSALLGAPGGGWERNDQLNSEWYLDGLKLACSWTNPAQISRVVRTFDEYASLSVWNEIRYPEFLTDPYSNSIQNAAVDVSPAFFKPGQLQLCDNYRLSRHVRLTPDPITRALEQEDKTLAVWLDFPNDRIGFARRELAVVLPLSSLKQLNFCTMDCDRHYEDRLYALLNSGEEMLLLYAAEGELTYLKQLLSTEAGLRTVDLGFQR